ncbi:hypothetical protein T484DRAFT_2987976 [Baffinella frigidus]|nr:hypothetical protein T484DRAFT_2987976 [Cryptophyta sp. CCMP2293]
MLSSVSTLRRDETGGHDLTEGGGGGAGRRVEVPEIASAAPLHNSHLKVHRPGRDRGVAPSGGRSLAASEPRKLAGGGGGERGGHRPVLGEAASGDPAFSEQVFGTGTARLGASGMLGDDKKVTSGRQHAAMYRAQGDPGGGGGGSGQAAERGGALRERFASTRGWRAEVGLPYLSGQPGAPHGTSNAARRLQPRPPPDARGALQTRLPLTLRGKPPPLAAGPTPNAGAGARVTPRQ